MESKVITIRLNEFDQEYLDLAKQIMIETGDFYDVDNSLAVKLAIRRFISTKISSDDRIKDKFFTTWSDLNSRNTKYLLNH